MKTAFRARYVFPVTAPPIPDGVVTVENGFIAAVGLEAPNCPITDLGNVAIIPGLINAHTHLEFSGLSAPLGTPGMAFTDWIRLVVAYRRRRANSLQIRIGANQCASHATVAVGDIVTTPPGIGRRGITRFFEFIGLKAELLDERLRAAQNCLSADRHGSSPVGLSPHAPYSVHPELFDRLLAMADEAQVPVAFHLAETLEELDLLATGDGPFRKLLIELGAWDETAIPRGSRPLDYLRRIATRNIRALVIHANFLDDEEMAILAKHADRMSVIYCPRTHAYFGHSRHPLPGLLSAGGNVALGTDSRASNPDLNLLEEIRFVGTHYPELPPSTALELGTLRGARALGIEHNFGSLEPGKCAALAAVPLADADADDPHWLIYESDKSAQRIVEAWPGFHVSFRRSSDR